MSHEYLSTRGGQYRECGICEKRTTYTCIRCGACYSCHPVVERAGGTQLTLFEHM